MLLVVDLNRNFPRQGQTDDTGAHIFLRPAITGAAITGSQLFQHRLITDDVKDITFIVGDIYGKAGAGKQIDRVLRFARSQFPETPGFAPAEMPIPRDSIDSAGDYRCHWGSPRVVGSAHVTPEFPGAGFPGRELNKRASAHSFVLSEA